MDINESFVIERLMEHYKWDNQDIEVLEAVASDLMYGPIYVLSEDSEHIEDTVYVYDPKLGQTRPCYLGSWGSEGIIGDFFPVGIEHVRRMFADLDPMFVNTDYDEVFFGSENKLWDVIISHNRECTSFEEWNEEYANSGGSEQEYDEWGYRIAEYEMYRWQEFDLTDILALFIGPRTAREIVYHL